ncbi:SLAIN motif-containing protein 1-like [Gouania willdenowi]|uniref:SLAIN motif-containing protein 1-like n=1 Tax=Gouania willdenowi TaxID=441366 RepID=A0A8C5DHV1_GOUWI|nr:SLAIN motif-containing protein 1-like [Gouania willdenowi]
MEAAVCSQDPGLEVQKLHDLVRKLELQNEQLRTRSTSSSTFAGEPGDGAGCSVLDEVELLDLDSLSGSDHSEETWLYVAPMRAGLTQTNPVSPLKWCRQIQDEPKSNLDSRRSLAFRVEQASRWQRSSSSPDPSSRFTSSPITSTKPCSTPPQTGRWPGRSAHPPLSSPLHPVLQRSLSPIRKEISVLAGRTATFIPHLASRNKTRIQTDRTQSCKRGRPGLGSLCSGDSDLGSSELDDDSSPPSYKLHDLTDVQVMARLQEESLRKHFVSAASSVQLSDGCRLQDRDDHALSRPALLACLPHAHTFCSTRGWRKSCSTPPSTPSTPPHLPAGFSFLAPPLPCLCTGSLRAASDKLQRSLPVLLRASSIPRASAALLPNSHSFDSSWLARLKSSSHLHSRSVDSFRPLKSSHCVGSSGFQSASGAGISLHRLDGGGTSVHSMSRCSLPRPSPIRATRSLNRSRTELSAQSFLTPPKTLFSGSALRACY